MPVGFTSTRDSSRSTVDFVRALQAGLAPDGGLFVPVSVPDLPADWACHERFADLGVSVVERWLEGTAIHDAVPAAITDALSFPVELVRIAEGVYVLELFHGPTLSFKDFGARTMARLMAASLGGREVTVMVATSGDTGSAVADGFSGVPGVRVILLYPRGQVSPTQERQLIVERPGVTSLRVEGTFDDCQRLVKGAFADPGLAHVPLSSANSINIGRLLPQSLYYLWAAARLGEPHKVCVPSGNLGNMTAAVFARMGGAPIEGFLAAHNSNRFFPDYLAGQDASFQPSIQTLSNAMDVGAPSNFERLEWLLGRQGLQLLISGETVSDADTVASMRRVHKETGYLADPHTAVGLEAVRRRGKDWRGEGRPVVVASTAHPAKFPDTVESAIGEAPEVPDGLAAFWDRPIAVRDIAATPEALREVILAA